MYTDNNNSNNDKDGEEKKFIPLMIKNNGHQNPLPHQRKNQNQASFLKWKLGKSGQS